MAGQGARNRQGLALALLMAVQAACAAFFIIDIAEDFAEMPVGAFIDLHISLELVANLALIAAIAVEGIVLRRLLAQQARADRALSLASGALHEVMERHFATWGLTPSEADVASFTIKGCSIAEVARLRGSGEGAVKSHLNAIYRKSGLAGRSQLVGLLIDDLLDAPPFDRKGDTDAAEAGTERDWQRGGDRL
jgi:DNA-binding CsgD family transcriptional regulator